MLGSICCMQTYFYLEEVSRHYQSYLQRITTRKMIGKHLYTTIAHKRKKNNAIFSRTWLTLPLMPSNTLALQIYEHTVLKCTFLEHHRLLLLLRKRKKTSFKRRQLFARAKKVWSLLSIQKKVAAARTEKLYTQLHTGQLPYRR